MRGGGPAPAGESTDGTAQMSQARRTRRGRRRPDGQHHIVPDNQTQPVIGGAPRAKGRAADWTDERRRSEEGRRRVRAPGGERGKHSYITCVDYQRTRILALPYCSIYVRSFAERTERNALHI